MIWKVELKAIKTLIKGKRKQIKNQKKKGQTKINIITFEKNYKFDLKEKIKKYIKTLTKEPRKKNEDKIARNN